MSDQLVLEHLDLARITAKRYARQFGGYVAFDELHSDALLGLVEAARNFHANRGVKFRSFASVRIEGAILDGIRNRTGGRRKFRANWITIDDAPEPSRIDPAFEEIETKQTLLSVTETLLGLCNDHSTRISGPRSR